VKRGGPYCDGYLCYSIPLPIIVAIIVGILVFIGSLIALYFIIRCLRKRRALRKDEYAQQVTALPTEPIAFNLQAFSS
jgi:hypothetical protein